MSRILLIILIGVFTSCSFNKTLILEKEKRILTDKLDSLVKINDSIIHSNSFIFEKAILLERNSPDSAKRIYINLTKSKEISIWTTFAEERLVIIMEKEKQSLKDIFYGADTLILRQRNEKCGEWGGNIEEIKIYFQGDIHEEGYHALNLTAFYKMNEYNCNDLEKYPIKANPKIYISKPKILDYEQLKIAEDCIFDLLKYKLNNKDFMSPAGIENSVELKSNNSIEKHPSIFINDYPSFGWEKFHILKGKIMN